MSSAFEVNFDGLVGTTHHYAGLSYGNVASMKNQGSISNPREAALQGLAKMKVLADLGLKQAILPPHPRPSIDTLRKFGFTGSDAAVLRAAAQQAPELLAACSSSSAMWVANAATMAPSSDTTDHRVHFTIANLASKLHRSIEPEQTERTLRAIFRDQASFEIHGPVPDGHSIADEGAANHTRLTANHARPGLHFFVFGKTAFGKLTKRSPPTRFDARQSLEASQAAARLNRLDPQAVCFAQQNPDAIDAGVFHNDVISVGNENVFLYHERSFVQTRRVVQELRQRFANLHPGEALFAIKVPERRVTLAEAVRSYFFNSQLVTLEPGRMLLCAPMDCQRSSRVRSYIEELIEDDRTPIREVRYFDLRQSMRNGGGPACLRLRVVLTTGELAKLPPNVLLHDENYSKVCSWVNKHYREQLSAADLADPKLVIETYTALDELTRLLDLGAIYPFQR